MLSKHANEFLMNIKRAHARTHAYMHHIAPKFSASPSAELGHFSAWVLRMAFKKILKIDYVSNDFFRLEISMAN